MRSGPGGEGTEANNLNRILVLGSRLTICLELAVKAGDCRLLQGAAHLPSLRMARARSFCHFEGRDLHGNDEME